MFTNFLKTALRNIRKNKLYAFINVTGLSIAVALSVLIYLFIRDELSYDSFHTNRNQIYRVETRKYIHGDEKVDFPLEKDRSFRFAWQPTALGPMLKEEIPDIKEYSRYADDEAILSVGSKAFNEKISYVDPGFLKMFDFEMLEGNKNSVLNDLHDIVITPAVGKKYFGNEDPIGKSIHINIWDEKNDFIVTGIIKEAPGNSSFKFNILLRQELRPWYKEEYDNLNSYNTPLFIELSPQTNIDQFNHRLEIFRDKYFGKIIADDKANQKLPESAKILDLAISPLTKIHLDKNVGWFDVSDPTYSYVLGAIGLLIFIIACLNYISLSISNSAGRSTEIGIRKVLGAGRSSLAGYFWGESQLMAVFSVLLGISIAYFLVGPFNRLAGKSISLSQAFNPWFLIFAILMTLLVGLLAGGYPAIFLSKFKPLDVLKKGRSGKYNLSFTRGMVILQYALSGILITSSLIMFRQMKYITTTNLGFKADQVIVVPTYTGWNDEGERLVDNVKNQLSSSTFIKSIAGVNCSFNRGGWSKNGFDINGKQHYAYIYRTDPDYVRTLGLQVIAGRNFNAESPYDTKHAILVNEELVKDYGWENPVGEHLYWRDDSVADEIVGVVKNYHYMALTDKIEPVIIALSPNVSKEMMVLIKINHENIPGGIKAVEDVWKSQYPDKPFDYSFLDEDVASLYVGYQRWMNIMGWSTGLAIFIACLGLFGLAGISASNRTREMSIRKVFGAGISNLFILLNKEVVILAAVSFMIATPVSWYFMNRWLDTFAYRIGIPWAVFIIAIFSGILVAVVTVSYHSIRTALVNPAKILKDE